MSGADTKFKSIFLESGCFFLSVCGSVTIRPSGSSRAFGSVLMQPFSTSLVQNILVFCLSVHSDSGGRQLGPRPEVGRQRDQVRQRNQGWQDGHGKNRRRSLRGLITNKHDLNGINLLTKKRVMLKLPKFHCGH